MEPNFELLRKVKASILAHPWRYNQAHFCGTAHCIGGEVLFMVDPDAYALLSASDAGGAICMRAAELLRLDRYQVARLLPFAGHWPTPFNDLYDRSSTAAERAQVAADRIDFFIATHGTDVEQVLVPEEEEEEEEEEVYA